MRVEILKRPYGIYVVKVGTTEPIQFRVSDGDSNSPTVRSLLAYADLFYRLVETKSPNRVVEEWARKNDKP